MADVVKNYDRIIKLYKNYERYESMLFHIFFKFIISKRYKKLFQSHRFAREAVLYYITMVPRAFAVQKNSKRDLKDSIWYLPRIQIVSK